MLTLQIPTLLALLATALMAVVIFAPERVVARPTISFAPPLGPAPLGTAPPSIPPLERWNSEPDSFPDPTTSFPDTTTSFFDLAAYGGSAPSSANATTTTVALSQPPAWPALVDRRAAGCDAPARLALVEALITIGTPWSRGILRRVLDDESDPGVRSAVIAAGIGKLDAAA